MFDYAPIARGFAKTRKHLGLTHYQLAKKAGVSFATITMLEQEKANPTLGTIARAANALGYKATITMTPLDKL